MLLLGAYGVEVCYEMRRSFTIKNLIVERVQLASGISVEFIRLQSQSRAHSSMFFSFDHPINPRLASLVNYPMSGRLLEV
jgi:hypothetical protein